MNINLTLFAQAAAFALFIWFTYRFVWPPLMGAIEARQKHIADGLAASEAGRNSLSKAEADRILVAAKAEIQQEMARAKESLRDQLGDLVVAGASKILQREVDAKAHADLIAAIKQQL